MKRVLAESMEDGAVGVAYALIYPPDAYADTEELIDVCRAMAPYGGVYVTHLRSEAHGMLEALEEALTIGREAGVAVEVYHLKAADPGAWHLMPSVIDRIERARADGQDVTADMYPYAASGTGLTAVLPTWTAEGGRLYERLRDPEVRARVRATLEGRGERSGTLGADGLGLETRGGPNGIMPVGFRRPEHQAYVGKRLDEIAAHARAGLDRHRPRPVRGGGSAHQHHLLLDGRGQPSAAGGAAVDQVRHRCGWLRPGVGEGPWAGPPARLRHLPARPTEVRPRGAGAVARGGRAQDDVRGRRPPGARRPRPAARGRLRRRGRLRPRTDRRPRHVRGPAPAVGGGALRVGQRGAGGPPTARTRARRRGGSSPGRGREGGPGPR